MMARLRLVLRRRGWPRVVLEGLLVVQALHLGEHLAQMIQLHILGWSPATARGIVSNLDVETVHFAWNLVVLATLGWLVTRGMHSTWLVATLAWASLHTAEHGFLLARALATGVEGAPGIVGAGGWIARRGWDLPGVTTWSRPTVHVVWNTVEVALLAATYLASIGGRLLRAKLRVLIGLGPAATLVLLTLIPSMVGAPVAGVTALAPGEIWIDGLGAVNGIAIDAAGHLYVSDADAGTVTRMTPDRTRAVIASGLDQPMGLAIDSAGRLLIAEERAGRIVRVETNGGPTPVATGLRRPRWLAVSPRGVVFVAAQRSGPGDAMAILALHPDGRLVPFADDFKNLEGLAAGDDVVFAAATGRRGEAEADGVIFQIDVRPDFSAGPIAPYGPTDRLKTPVGLALDRLGALYVTAKELGAEASRARDAIAKLHGDGTASRFAADLREPQALALDGDGHLYVADGRAGRVIRFRAPSAPALDALPPFTNQSPITVSGVTEAGARVDALGEGGVTPVTVSADASGKFGLAMPLAPDVANRLEIWATGHGGDGLTSPAAEASVVHDGAGPSIVFESPAAGFVRQTVTVQAQAADAASGVAQAAVRSEVNALSTTVVPAPPAASVIATASWNTHEAADGTHTLTAVASDRAGNSRTITRVIVVDNTPPDTQISGGPSGEIDDTTATFTASGGDNLTPPASLAFAWRLDGAAFSAFSTATARTFTGLTEGDHTVEVKARDLAGNEDPTPAARPFTVTTRPAIAGLSPISGPVGTLVTITGTGFVPGATQVAFNGDAAIVRSVAPASVTTIVPPGARSGPVTVTTPRGTATSTPPFTVTTSQDFAVQVVPSDVQLVPGASATCTIALVSSADAPFVGLATLSVTGLPAGVTGAFAPAATVSGNQPRTLVLTAAPAAAPGAATITIAANATADGASVTRTVTATVHVLAGGRTAALGQVTFADGTPIAGVRLTLAGVTTTSDAGGNFRLLDVPAGAQMLGVDANAAQSGLPIYGVDVTLNAGQATQLAPFRITPPPPPERFASIANATSAHVVTDPRFPGLSITLPAGVTITGWDGTAKTRIALERLSPDTLPVPPPPGPTRSLYQVFFGTPMGGLPSAPLPVTVPNDQELEPGDKADIWYYDAAPLPGVPAGWRLAGLGTVSADGSRVVSDPGVGIPRFCGVCGVFCIVKNVSKQANVNPNGPKAGEPVDLGTGLMLVDATDLLVPGRIPALLRRSHNPLDPFGRIAGFEVATGPGWTLSIDVVLLRESASIRRLILPGNARFPFVLQPDGTFLNTTFPAFTGAVMRAQPDGNHTLRFRDGLTWSFATGYIPRVGGAFVIGGLHLLVAQTDRNGNTLTITRDAFGAPTRITEPGGRSLALTVDGVAVGVGRLLSVTDPIGRTVRYGYTAAAPFRLETVTDPTGGVTRYDYTASGAIAGITDPRGITFLVNEYDPQGRVLRQTQADGGVWTFAYSGPAGAHTSATVTDPRGHRTIHRMDNAGFSVETVDALGQLTRHERDAVGRIVTTTDALGRVSRFIHDAVGDLVRTIDPAGHVRTFTYEPAFHRVTSITDPLGHVTRLEYDAAGNLTTTVDPLGQRTTFTYDGAGQPLTATDPLGHVTRFEYDAAGDLTATVDPLGHRTTREYDAVSRLIRQRNALGQTTATGYDLLNRVETVLDAAAGVTRLSYDPNGNLLTVTDARGGTTRHTYDAMDRLATRTDPVGATESFDYDPLGNLTRHVDRKNQVAFYTYDGLNRRTQSRYADATVDVVYDGGGRMVAVTDSMGGTVLNQYDALDRLLNQTTVTGVIGYGYDAARRRVAMTVPGQATVTYGYDQASRLTSITQGSPLVQLQHDAAGRRTRLTLPNQVSTEYQYDPASRLTALVYRNAAGPVGDIVYGYDAAGSRSTVAGSLARTLLPDPVPTATYDPANRQLTFGDTMLTYDANGNLSSDGATSYVWDARNRLAAISGSAGTAAFDYDARGRRARTIVAGVETRFHHDGVNPVQLLSSAEGVTDIVTGLGVDEFLLASGPADRAFLTDALGSTIAELDASGVPVTEHTYEPFGRASTTGGPTAPFRYTGRDHDETGLYYYRTRYYAPTLHRFISEDWLGLRAGVNPYAYVGNNPTNAVDPLGLLTVIVHGMRPWTPGIGYSGELQTQLVAAGETVVEVRWNGNPLSVEGNTFAIQRLAEAAAQSARTGEPLNIVGHSWGSVIAANALANTGITADRLITLGSPLSRAAALPTGAKCWVNIASPVDPISWASYDLPARQLSTWVYHFGYWNDPITVEAVVRLITDRR